MTRRGSTKVRTGCFTCKLRKVKCDETKPHCQRCISTGRKCDGYPRPPTGQAAYSWAELLAIRDVVPIVNRRTPTSLTTDAMEARALDFFRAQVAPVLSRHSSTHFWNTLVSQVGQQEPAVRHALVCISAMYEGLGETNHRLLATPRELFAIRQYNLSLKQLTGSGAGPGADAGIVLLVCLLFICIEMLQGNKDAAIEHCRHGITICNSMSGGLLGWARRELQPILLRMATFPYFFGVEVTDFPEPVGLVSDPLATGVTAEEKDTAWNYLINRAVRFVRLGLSHRQGPLQSQPRPESLFSEQQRLRELLVVWHEHYRAVRTTTSIGPDDLERHLYDEMKCIVGKIWVACCLNKDEMVYDEHNADFEELIHLCEQLVHLRSTETGPPPKFIFEMGFMPFLYFIAIHCRRLDIRLKALRYMPLISHGQESLFNSKTMYYVAMRSVELEHGIHIDPDRLEDADALDAPMPPDEMRIRSADICCEWELKKDENGQEFESRKVFFNVKPGAIVPGFVEWIRVGPYVRHRPSRCCGSTAEGHVCLVTHRSHTQFPMGANTGGCDERLSALTKTEYSALLQS